MNSGAPSIPAGWILETNPMKRLSFIMVPNTSCNAVCGHCFESDVRAVMSTDDLRVIGEKIARLCSRRQTREVVFYWQGGEVFLLGPRWFEDMHGLFQEIFEQSGLEPRIVHHIQTNLLLYDKSWNAVIREVFQGKVGSSVDYPNLYRRTREIETKDYNTVWKNKLDLARDSGLQVGVISLINHETLARGAEEFLDYLTGELCLKFFQINLPFAGEGQAMTRTNLDPMQTGEFLVDLLHLCLDRQDIKITPLNGFMERLAARDMSFSLPCIWSRDCSRSFFSIGPDGRIGLCDAWITSRNSRLYGNILTDEFEEILNHGCRADFQKRLGALLAQDCGECDFLAHCHGGCPMRTWSAHGDIKRKDPYCGAYKLLFQAITQLSHNNSREVFHD